MWSKKNTLAIIFLVLAFLVCYGFDFYWRCAISVVVPFIFFISLDVFKNSRSTFFYQIYESRIVVVPVGVLFLNDMVKCF